MFKRRIGLTLLELLVVLTILIALGGIVVASLPGLLTRTQAATGAANVSEIDSAIRRNLLTRQGHVGNRFDSLIVGSSTLNGDISSFVGGRENFQATSVSGKDLRALANLGITQLIPAIEGVQNATFESHDQLPVTLENEVKVCQLRPDYAAKVSQRLWNIDPGNNKRYLLFGLGQRCSLVGGGEAAIFKDAPVHFSDNSLSNPRRMYARYLLVIELESAGELESKARYIGTVIPHLSGIVGLNDQLEDFYNNED